MTDFLPLFPLKLVVFPGEKLNLHIFEPRYKQLVRECEQNKITFGIPAFIDDKVMEMGTELRLRKVVRRHDNGEMDIKTEGVGLFQIRNFYKEAPNKLYSGADITRLDNEFKSDPLLNQKILKYMGDLFEVLKIDKPLPDGPESFSTYDIAHQIGFSLEQEYEMLCLTTEYDRQAFISEHLQKLLPVVREMERLRKKVQLNGHFKNIIPPKLK
ncbi:MAG: LON peptidase substrate-binding domain-containing protein [Bacteroidota bacterium]